MGAWHELSGAPTSHIALGQIITTIFANMGTVHHHPPQQHRPHGRHGAHHVSLPGDAELPHRGGGQIVRADGTVSLLLIITTIGSSSTSIRLLLSVPAIGAEHMPARRRDQQRLGAEIAQVGSVHLPRRLPLSAAGGRLVLPPDLRLRVLEVLAVVQ